MILYLLSLVGVAVFAISGALEAGQKKFDLMGVTVIAVITALGGGTIRDVLLGRYPISWIEDPIYLIVALLSAVLTFFCYSLTTNTRSLLLYADAVGLALFTISGTQLAESVGAFPLIQIVMGTITGSAGGVLRDVLCGEAPLLFRSSETLYATAAILGSSVYIMLKSLNCDLTLAAMLGMLAVGTLRVLAIVYGLKLPEFGKRGKG